MEEELQARLRELAREVRRLRQELDESHDPPSRVDRLKSSVASPPPRRKPGDR